MVHRSGSRSLPHHPMGAQYLGSMIQAIQPIRYSGGAPVDMMDIVEEAKSRGLKFPILVRFQDILRHRVEFINRSFELGS